MKEFFSLPIFGVFITLLAFFIAQKIRLKIRHPFLNPVLVAIAIIMIFLLGFDIDFETYNIGGKYLSFFLGPSIVALGVLFYEKYTEIKHNLLPFLFAVLIGGIVSIISVTIIAILLNAPDVIIKSIASKLTFKPPFLNS